MDIEMETSWRETRGPCSCQKRQHHRNGHRVFVYAYVRVVLGSLCTAGDLVIIHNTHSIHDST